MAVCLALTSLPGTSFAQVPQQPQPSPPQQPSSPQKDTAKLPLAPPSTKVIVGRIIVQGNRKTKTYIVERELSFHTGDTLNLEDLVKSFSFAHDRLINTHLFNDVVIFLKRFRGYTADIEIDVKERWYIFPVPYFKPVDRNLSAWAQKDYDLKRVNYGAKFSHFNFTGRNDNLTAWLITGYTRQFELYYNQPYADKSLKHGFGFGFTYAQLRELDARTLNNQQDFINSDSIPYAGKWLSQQFSFSARYFYRPGLKVRHTVNMGFTHVDVDTAVTVVNKYYFDGGRKEVLYPELSYSFNYTDVDYVAYPLKGVIFESGFTRRGIDARMNLWQFYAKLTRSWKLGRKWYFGFESSDVLKLPLRQPFFNQQLIGYSDMYLRGLDRYVIDGVAGGILRNTLYRELFNFSIPFTRYASHDRIPIRIYATAFSDYGYSYNRDFPDNSLVNRLLYTAGVGVDLVTFYDLSFKFDYSFNQLGQNGLFLHIRDDF
ncbi:MAG: POTRA domain-containing protein [Bacteroidota bacterium]|nr:POTRA domain-containing protein [Bacteroidota bacterium]MDP4216988.1 POTRA domain-containing protein [Bacteroidota bacterium]MDP4245200.1 POTRA domain-containing protein [Bacteroidota bacterium]MDP4258265.1 POTRA domain-containing protein [Bacteroidota bacterium]